MAEEKKTTPKATAKKTPTTPKETVAKPAATKAPVKKAPVNKVVEEKAVEEKVVEVKEKAPVSPEPVKKAAPKKPKQKVYTSRLKQKYDEEVKKAMVEKFNYKSIMQVPVLEKIVVNIGVGDATTDSKRLDESIGQLGLITGQHPVVTKAKKSVASFKVREGQAIGCKVTLRGKKMYEFFDKLVSIALPRVRDFRGTSANAFDGRGNYTLGVKEQLIFPEIDYDKVGKIRGMDIVIVTTAKTDKEALELLTLLGMPFHR